MEDWKKGSYYFSELTDPQEELEILKRVSSTVAGLEKSIWLNLNLDEHAHIMDLGCGPGLISTELAKCFPAGTVVGVDLSPDLLTKAKERQKAENINNLMFMQSDIYDLDIGETNFDLIYLRFVLQHLKNPIEAIYSASKVLKPGATICAIDIDDDEAEFYPELACLNSFNKRAVDGQIASGGDRKIGKKLHDYFTEAGLSNVKSEKKRISSKDIGLKTFLDLTIKIKVPAIAESQKQAALAELEEVYSACDNPDAWGTMDITVATGEKASN